MSTRKLHESKVAVTAEAQHAAATAVLPHAAPATNVAAHPNVKPAAASAVATSTAHAAPATDVALHPTVTPAASATAPTTTTSVAKGNGAACLVLTPDRTPEDTAALFGTTYVDTPGVNVLVVPTMPRELLTTSYEQAERGVGLLRYAIPPGSHTPIALKMTPYAAYTLRPEGASNDYRGLPLVADSDGFVRFYFQSFHTPRSALRYVLASEDGGDRLKIHIRPSFFPITGWAPPTPVPRALRSSPGELLPALTEEEQMCLSNEELLRRGYPPRPHPKVFVYRLVGSR